MRKRTTLPMIFSTISGSIILLAQIAFGLLNIEFTFYAYLLSIISACIIIGSGICSYFVNDRPFGIVNVFGTLLSYIGLRMFFKSPIEVQNVYLIIITVITELALVLNIASVILSIYRLPINQTHFNNQLFGDLPADQKPSILFAILNIIVLLIIIFSLAVNKLPMTITIVCCLISIIMIVVGKILSTFYHQRIGSLVVLFMPFVLILGANPKEFSVDNTCVIIMVAEYLLAIILLFVEMIKFEEGEDTKFGPKEYKQK